MTFDEVVRKVSRAVSNPRLVGYILNAQLQMAWRANVPPTVRLRGRIRMVSEGTITIGDGAILLGTVVPLEIIAHRGARVSIGQKTFINYGTSISAHEEVRIGERCKIGHYVFLMDNNQHDLINRTELPPSAPIVIENDVWIGAHAIILPGVHIGRNAVVGAGSVVTRNVPADTIVAGNPAKFVRALPASPIPLRGKAS